MSECRWPDPSGKYLLPPHNNVLRSYDPTNDIETWSEPLDSNAVLTRMHELMELGHTTRIYTEAEMRKRGWSPPPEVQP
jgi:hypothetical protein